MPEPLALPVIVLVRDLLFSSRITATARSLGVPTRLLRDPGQLAGATGDRAIVDLNQEGVLAAAAAWKGATGGEVTGFVSHVDGATIAAARNAGLDRVMPRSQFVNLLPDLLAPAAAAADRPLSSDHTDSTRNQP